MRRIVWLTILAMVVIGPACAQGGTTNLPPSVSIVWPTNQGAFWNSFFTAGVSIKIKANATDPDGFVSQIQFFADTNLIGVVTNAPFNLLWQVPCKPFNPRITLKAVAVDNLGARTESAGVVIGQSCTAPATTVLEVLSPRDGALLAAPATIVFSAELLAAYGGASLEFFWGTNSIGVVDALVSATAPPVSVTLSNLLEGEYQLSLQDRGNSICSCFRMTNTIRVVQLGVQSRR